MGRKKTDAPQLALNVRADVGGQSIRNNHATSAQSPETPVRISGALFGHARDAYRGVVRSLLPQKYSDSNCWFRCLFRDDRGSRRSICRIRGVATSISSPQMLQTFLDCGSHH